MGGTDIASSQHRPPCVVPERGQVTEHSSESPNKECCAVLHEHVFGSYFAHDARHVVPQSASLSVDAGSLSGEADVLARKSSRYHVNKASPRSSVKRLHFRPNRESWEGSIVLSLNQNLCAVGITLNGADTSPAELVAREYSSTRSSEEGEFS